MEDFNPRSPIRLSDIDNLLQESIFESSDGAKLVEYLKKKRGGGGGRVRLQNIFQQVPVQRAQFNFNLDSTDPTPLPESPQPTTSSNAAAVPVPAVVQQNYVIEQQPIEIMANGESAPVVVTTMADANPPVPIVIVNDLNQANMKMHLQQPVKQIVLKSPGPMNALSRQVLINQYQRTNAAKCELLKQLATSTPRPESNGSLGRMSTFTSSISPISESGGSPLTAVVEVIPSDQQPPVRVMEIVVPPVASQEVLVPCSQPILAPCSQAVGATVETVTTPQKVVVLKTVVEPYNGDEVVIPETPSPVKMATESPKAPPHPVPQPRRLSTTFKQMEVAAEEEAETTANGHMTSDESEAEEEEEEEQEQEQEGGSNSVLLKSILKDTSMGGGGRSRHSFRVSFSRQLVQQREISPAPSIPEANDYNDSNSTDDSDGSDSDMEGNEEYQVVDEVYTDDDGEEGDSNEVYEELKSRICELNNSHNNGRRSVSPLIDVVKETPVQWFETTTPTKRSDQQDAEEQQYPPPTTAKKDNKTNLQLVDIITDWDDEEDEEEGEQSASNPEIEAVPEQRASTNSNHHDTNLDTMDISSSNLEDSVERLVELPPAPNGLIEEEGVLPEEHIYPAAVDESMPIVMQSMQTTEELVEVLSEDVDEIPATQPEAPFEEIPETQPDEPVEIPETQPEPVQEEPVEIPEPVQEQPVELPPPPTPPDDQADAPPTPERVITPPVQFTTSAKRRFIKQNEEELISRLQNDLPLSQPTTDNDTTIEEPIKPSEKVSETLVEIAQSFRDQPATLPSAFQPPPEPPVVEVSRKVVQPAKRGRKKSTATDPVTASYFEAIEKTFAKPKAQPVKGVMQQKTKKTEQQKRKLYDATLLDVTEDEASVRETASKPVDPIVTVVAPPEKPKEVPKIREFKVVVQKLKIEDYLPKKKAPIVQAALAKEVSVQNEDVPKVSLKGRRASKDKRSEPAGEEVAKVRGRRASRDKPQQQQPPMPVPAGTTESATKKPRGRRKKVQSESTAEQQEEVQPAENLTQELPGLAGDSPQERTKEVEAVRKDKVEENKRKKEVLPISKVQPEIATGRGAEDKSNKLKQSVDEDSQSGEAKKKSQHATPNESLPTEAPAEVVKLDSGRDKPKEKKKLKPNLAATEVQLSANGNSAAEAKKSKLADVQEAIVVEPTSDESLPTEAPAEVVKLAGKDKPREKKKPSANGISVEEAKKNNVVEVEEDTQRDRPKENSESQQQLQPQPDESLPTEAIVSAQVVEPDSGKDKPKKKLKPNLAALASKEQQPEEGLPSSNGILEAQETKKKRLKPNLVGDSQKQQSADVVIDADVEDSRKDKAKKKLKPNLAAASQKEQPFESVTSVEVVEPNSDKNKASVASDAVAEPDAGKKKKLKPNLAAASEQQQPDESLPSSNGVSEEKPEEMKKRKKLKPNLAAAAQKEQQPVEIQPAEPVASAAAVGPDSGQDKPKEKKKLKPNLAAVQKPVESVSSEAPPVEEHKKKKKLKPNLAAISPVTAEQQDSPVEITTVPAETHKKKLKPNLAAVSPVTDDSRMEQPAEPTSVPAEPPSTKDTEATKKKKLKPNFGTKSKQQYAEDRLNEEQQAVPEPSMTTQEPAKPMQKKKQQRKSLDGRLEKQQPKAVAAVAVAEVKVKLTKVVVDPTAVSMSPASKAILQATRVAGGVEPSPVSRKLFSDDGEVQSLKVAVKKSRKASTDAAAEDQRAKRKEVKRAKLKEQQDGSVDPIPKVRISAEKNGVYRITTPPKEPSAVIQEERLAEPLNATELNNSGTSIRTSLEDNPEDFLGFEDANDESTVADISVDLSRSNMELVIPLEKAPIPEGVVIPDNSSKIKKQRRQSRSPHRKRSRSVRNSTDVAPAVEPPKPVSPERPATSPSKIDNDSLPLKKRKSRDSSREYHPEEPEQPPQPEPVEQLPQDLNDSMLIPVLQRVPIADKYLVRSSPDRDGESAENAEYDSDDSSCSNVLIVRKDHSRFEQSLMLDSDAEREEEERVKNLNKKSKDRKSIPLPRFYGDNTFDITWVPKQRKTTSKRNANHAAGSRQTKRRHDNDSGIEEEEAVRRSKRTCRISKAILMTNPLIKSAYDKPNYRPMTVEQLLEAETIAKKLTQEEKARYRKKPATAAGRKNHKRIQEASEEDQQQQAKRNRVEEAVDVQPSTSAGTSSSTASAGPSTSSASSSVATAGVEVAIQADVDTVVDPAALQHERLQAQSWMMKLMADNSGREEVMPQATSSGDRMHFQLDHLTFQERNGIQYSFFIYSETENFGFLRFAPAAVKKWTKTADFLLKFLVLHGQLSFQINGKETITKGGDFLMLPQNTRYRIQNSDEISLVFMIKFRAAPTGNELPSM